MKYEREQITRHNMKARRQQRGDSRQQTADSRQQKALVQTNTLPRNSCQQEKLHTRYHKEARRIENTKI
jgi:hypothetical protein